MASEDHHARMTLRGAFDAHNVPTFESDLQALIQPGFRIDLDLAEVTFLDSSVLAALIAAHLNTREVGGALHLVAMSPMVQRLLEVTGLSDQFLT